MSTRNEGEHRRPPDRKLLRRYLYVLVVGLIALLTWKDVLLLFSSARPVVAALDRDVVYVQDGVPGVDVPAIQRAIGKRPVTVSIVTGDSAVAQDKADACADVVDRIDGIMHVVIADGEFVRGCQSDDFPIVSSPFAWDFVTWSIYGDTTQFIEGDHRAMAEQLVAYYDSEVFRGRVLPGERVFTFSAYRYLFAAGLLVGMVLLVHFGTRWLGRGAAGLAARREQRARWRVQRADLESELALVAMRMVAQSPRRSLGETSEQYLAALADWEAAKPGQPWDELRDRVAALRERVR
ncbi:hypothetical protein [Actinokineospora pegani]|uniref:hypothetical protein n=1 Tax=Actinokineospora pegani TaxID=2654637 RepID=UPI0012EA62BF|nr:hypothetical protein [Actinokineospora pegani]